MRNSVDQLIESLKILEDSKLTYNKKLDTRVSLFKKS